MTDNSKPYLCNELDARINPHTNIANNIDPDHIAFDWNTQPQTKQTKDPDQTAPLVGAV